jgi:phosphate transport system substrate-binding protein
VLVGAGSTFVAPLVSAWTADYAKTVGVTVTYGAVGSGAGIASITSPERRFRCERRAAEPGSGVGV